MPKGGGADRTSGRAVLSRRRAIAAGGGIVGASLAGGIGLRLVDRAAASADVAFTAGDVDITTADGSIDAVTVAPSGSASWQGLEAPPKRAAYELVVATDESLENEGDSRASTIAESDPSLGGTAGRSGEIDVELTQYDLLENGSYEKGGYRGGGTAPFDASDFEASADGSRSRTTVHLELTVELYGSTDDSPLVTASDETSFTVTVENAGAELEYRVTANTGVESDTAVDGSDSG